MRRLLGCPSCRRQFDTSALAVGSRFRCRCGTAIEVPDVVPQDAAVVHCRSCGATREEGASACRYCGSDFTIHEKDMHTICPWCLARISDSARFCHRCGTSIGPEEIAGEATASVCPACGGEHRLRSRALGESGPNVLECTRCAGLWLGNEAFRLLRERALRSSEPAPDPVVVRAQRRRAATNLPQPGPLYRRCPFCTELMTRFNYGRRSGVVLDRCVEHGMWFDASELEAALAWIRVGGERLAAERRAREERDRAVLARFRVEPKAPDDIRYPDARDRGAFDVLPWILGRLFDR